MNAEETGERGVILVALLWILVALSIIALSFTREGFVEVAAARNARDLTDAYYVARAGIATTIYRIVEKKSSMPVQGIELGPPDPLDLGVIEGDFAGGQYHIDVQDESGKININFASDEQLRALMEALRIPQPDADVMVDSIADWKDADTAHHINGAEDDYYQALPRPYKAKNGRLDTVEELLLVRGVTREYFYGYPEKSPDGRYSYRYGLWKHLTVYSNSNRININYADLPVLLSIPGMNPHTAQQIYERRKTKPFKNLAEVTQDLAVTIDAQSYALLSTEINALTPYSLTAISHMANSKAQRVIRAVVVMDSRESSQYRVLYWNENVPNL